jgi:hypothetical protein
MTELELYKYITDNNIEWHRHDNEGTPDVIILPYTFQLEDFNKLIVNHDTDDGLLCRLKNGYAAIWMKDLCEYYGIKMNNVFVGEEY